MPMAVIAAAVVVTAGTAIYSVATAPKPPKIPPPPPPANYYSYDDQGNPSGEQVWDAEKNAYIYKPAPLTEAQKVEKAKKEELRSKYLGNLSEAPADRVKAYQDYADNFSSAMQRDVNKQFDRTVRSVEEANNRRGVFGSSGYADTQSRLREEKATADIQIAERANLAKEDLARSDRAFWMDSLSNLDAGGRADTALNIEKQRTASNVAGGATANILGGYGASNLASMQRWQGLSDRNSRLTDSMLNTTTGLTYLYGLGGNVSKGSVSSGKGSVSSGRSPFSSSPSYDTYRRY